MGSTQLNAKRLEIIDIAMNSDARTVTKILNFARQAEQETFERIPGVPHTREQLIESVLKSYDDIAAGRFVRHEDIAKKPL